MDYCAAACQIYSSTPALPAIQYVNALRDISQIHQDLIITLSILHNQDHTTFMAFLTLNWDLDSHQQTSLCCGSTTSHINAL